MTLPGKQAISVATSLRTTLKALAAATTAALVIAGCSSGASDSQPWDRTMSTQQACDGMRAIDASTYLGSGTSVKIPCGQTKSLPNEIGTQVWINGTRRVTVQVLGDARTFAAIRDQPGITPAQRDCGVGLLGGSRDCVDLTATDGNFIVDMGKTTLVVFASAEPTDPTESNTVKLITEGEQKELTDFAKYAAEQLYS